MSGPGETPRGAPERDPLAELTPEERARAKRRLLHRFQVSLIAFLVVVALGLLPAALSHGWPALGRAASIAAWILAPALPIGLVVFALLRLRR